MGRGGARYGGGGVTYEGGGESGDDLAAEMQGMVEEIKELVCRDLMSSVTRKAVIGVSGQFRHKPGCATTQDG